jgi:hypothetical protein
MGTLCKNCPCRGLKTETDSCMTLFAKKYHNSCVTYDITEYKVKQEKEKFMKELEKLTNEKKTIINNEEKTIGTEALNETVEMPTDDVVNTQEAQKKTISKTIKAKKASRPRKSREGKKTKETKKEAEIKNIETKDAIAEIVSSVANAAVKCENNNNQTE